MDQSTTICQAAEGPPHSLAQPAQLSETLSPTGSTHVSKGRRALFWSMSGTILSAVGFIALALFEQYNGMLAELRGDLKHFNEISSEFVKKDSLQRLRDHIRESLKDLQAACATRVQMEQRWGRLDRVGQTQTVHAYAFHDVTKTFEWEDRLLREYGFLE